MDLDILNSWLAKNNLPKYRFSQITKNYFSAKYLNFNEMTDLPKTLRTQLDQNIKLLSVKEENLISSPHTQKALLRLFDNKLIETVLMDYGDWLTACISSQVGCPLGCTFCATGKMGFIRNLTSEEIIDQIIYWNQKLYPKYIGRLVFMGMGEPFLNWDNLLSSIDTINNKNGLNIGARKISISTAGVADKIIQFADLETQINLAVSLHSANQQNRQKIMPIAKKYPLEELKKASQYFAQTTNRQIFFEYALIDGFNDSAKDIEDLKDFFSNNHLFYLNLIPLNPIKGGLVPSSTSSIKHFTQLLDRTNINYSIRRSFGQSIGAACGQLATQHLD